MVFGSKIAASRSMLNVDAQSKVGSLAALGEAKVVVATRKLLLHLGRWVSEAPQQEVLASGAVLVAEGVVMALEAASSHEEVMVVAAVVELAFREAVAASGGRTAMELPLQMLQQVPVALVAVDSLAAGEVMVDHPARQIATAPAVGMIRVVEVALTMTEMVEVGVDIVATNVTVPRVVVLEATWSR